MCAALNLLPSDGERQAEWTELRFFTKIDLGRKFMY
jgi:hypothetical protein